MKSSTKWLLITLALVAITVTLVLIILNYSRGPEEISITTFKEQAEKGEYEKVKVSGYKADIYVSGDKNPAYRIVFDSRIGLREMVESINETRVAAGKTLISLTFDDPNANSWVQFIWPALGLILLVVLMVVMVRQMGGGGTKAMGFAKSKARANENVKVRFTDVAGAEEEKEELREIVDFLKTPKKYSELGARIPKGVLLVGPPGTGKTLFAKAVAGEANVPFFSISGSDFVEMFVGVGASRVRDLFDMAKKAQPCIIFIDEIDAVGRQRGTGLGGGHDEREQTLNQLLVQMDGFETNEGIIVMAATNRADILDPALLRPGRFDRQIYVNPPDVRGREAIFKVHTRNKPMASDINYKTLARITSGFTGADIENLLNEAAILAARENRRYITMKDINEGINKVIVGPQKKSRIVTESDKRITAYHEAGHAIVARELEHCDPVHEVSIIPRGMAGGFTMTRPDNDDNYMTKNKIRDNMAMMIGGRVAEELVIKDISTGAQNDIQRMTALAKSMVTEWGMSEIGPLYLGGDQEVFLGRDYQAHKTYSEELAGKVDVCVSGFLEEAHKRAIEVLQKNIGVLHSMARLLVECETIYTEEIDMLFEGKSVEEIIKYIEEKTERESKESKKKDTPVYTVKEITITSVGGKGGDHTDNGGDISH